MFLHQAEPLNFLQGTENTLAITYFLCGGEFDGKMVLVSSRVALAGEYEETSIFFCADANAEIVDWESFATVQTIDHEFALNKIGYTKKLDKSRKVI